MKAAEKKPAEKMFECEVRRQRLKAAGRGYEWFWKVKTLQDASEDGDKDFRCKDCHGAVKVHARRVADGPAAHAVHRLKQDSEYCSLGAYFQQATDAREPRLSAAPVS